MSQPIVKTTKVSDDKSVSIKESTQTSSNKGNVSPLIRDSNSTLRSLDDNRLISASPVSDFGVTKELPFDNALSKENVL